MSAGQFVEIEILKRIRDDDDAAFEILFSTFYSLLCTYALTFVRRPEIAEEVVQEYFVKFWENRRDINITTSIKSYLYRSIHNYCLNYIRNSSLAKRHNDDYVKEINYRAQILNYTIHESEYEQLTSQELEQLFEKTIDALPAQCREIFLLSRNEQISYSEIAERLNISVSTVKTQMTRALEKLKGVLNTF